MAPQGHMTTSWAGGGTGKGMNGGNPDPSPAEKPSRGFLSWTGFLKLHLLPKTGTKTPLAQGCGVR